MILEADDDRKQVVRPSIVITQHSLPMWEVSTCGFVHGEVQALYPSGHTDTRSDF